MALRLSLFSAMTKSTSLRRTLLSCFCNCPLWLNDEPGCGDFLGLDIGGLVEGADAAVNKNSRHPLTPSVQKGSTETLAVHKLVKLAYGHGATACP